MSFSEFKIDKKTPIPPRVSIYRYPLEVMEAGDSFLVHDAPLTYLLASIRKFCGKFTQRKFHVQKAQDGFRCWRVDERIEEFRTTDAYPIEKNVPIPIARKYLLPFDQLEPGDSFFVADMPSKIFHRFVYEYSKRTGKKLTIRTTPEGVRCWRVTEGSDPLPAVRNSKSSITVEKGLPIPPHKINRFFKYPYLQMEIGDSFLVEKEKGGSLFTEVKRLREKYGLFFIVKKTSDGYRCWRLSEEMLKKYED